MTEGDSDPAAMEAGWRWYVFGRDTVDGVEASLMVVFPVPERVATPWRQSLTELLLGSEWEWEER